MTTDKNDISAISLLTQLIEHSAFGGRTDDDLIEELDDWLVIFRSTTNLADALGAVRVSVDGAAAAVCDDYLSALPAKGAAT